MKVLKKLLLINWHSFWNEEVEFETINFLTGKNAVGKSTMIDALQLLLLGDTSGYFFNKSANEKSGRTLKGYLYGEIGDDGDVGFHYLRNGNFTSYIACEFYDDIRDKSFTLGVVFDCYEDGTFNHRFFTLDDRIPSNRFIVNNEPMPFSTLRNYIRKNYARGKFSFPDSNRQYQEILRGKLGGLKTKYFSLFKKAVPFSPIDDIEKFITEYVCDVKDNVDVSIMQDNIRYYKRLEQDANMMEKRIQALEHIEQLYNAYTVEKDRLIVHRYIVERAKHQEALDLWEQLNRELEENTKKLKEICTLKKENEETLSNLENKKEKLIEDKLVSDIYNKSKELTDEKERLKKRLDELKEELKKVVGNLRSYGLVWRENIRKIDGWELSENDLEDNFLNRIKEEYLSLKLNSKEAMKYAQLFVNMDGGVLSQLDDREFNEARLAIVKVRDTASRLNYNIGHQKEIIEDQFREIKEQLEGLRRGIKPYNKKLLDLQYEIAKGLKDKYNKDIDVAILANLIEIPNARWRNAIEGYLHTQKFHLIVEPEYFVDALKIYDELKFKMGFYGWGIVDIGKLLEMSPTENPNSLAEEVETDNPYARLFIDYVLGNIIKCDAVEDLRNFNRAITDSCMLYQNFVVRQLNPERWKYPYIGRKAIEEQIRSKTQYMKILDRRITEYQKAYHMLHNIHNMEIMNENEIKNIIYTGEKIKGISIIDNRLRQIIDELGSLDLTWLMEMDRKIKEVEAEIEKIKSERDELIKEESRLNNENKNIVNEKMKETKVRIASHEENIDRDFDREWKDSIGEERFKSELERCGSALEVHKNFYSQVARTENQVSKKKEKLVAVRSDYNRDYKMSYDINASQNDYYNKELSELRDIRLPDYKEQIKDAKEKAYEQFRDDFLAKMKSNIDMVKIQIEELNVAIRESNFGQEKYRFAVKPKAEYKKYYDMITDNLLMEGHNISSNEFRKKHRDAIDELFSQITDVDLELNADTRAELEKNIKRFTNYKTYLSFDLIVTHEDDRDERLSRTLNKKSGGETQTPFYVSVLASFAQLYRVGYRGDSANTMRLIIFDEAFNKMDSERIQESIKLLKRFGLQAILSAPPEKIGDITPLVDRTLCIIRKEDRSFVRAFDSKELVGEDI